VWTLTGRNSRYGDEAGDAVFFLSFGIFIHSSGSEESDEESLRESLDWPWADRAFCRRCFCGRLAVAFR